MNEVKLMLQIGMQFRFCMCGVLYSKKTQERKQASFSRTLGFYFLEL